MENVLEWVRSILTTTPTRWTNLIESLPIPLLSEKPGPGEWSALDCLQHIVDTEQLLFPVRVKAFMIGQPFPSFDPDAQGFKSEQKLAPHDLLAEFLRLRSENLKLFAQLTLSDLERTNNHPDLGPVTLSQLLHNWAGHDLMHTVQAERALMQPFINGNGPWRAFYKDHIAKGKG